MSFNTHDVQRVIDDTFKDICDLRKKGQSEYAHSGKTPFGNFERISKLLEISKEQVLLVYLWKHMDGIASYLKGYESQREDVTGRINDAITYLCLLKAMILEKRETPTYTTGVVAVDVDKKGNIIYSNGKKDKKFPFEKSYFPQRS